MATYVKGDAVENATSYELLEKLVKAGEVVSVTKTLSEVTTGHAYSKVTSASCEIAPSSGTSYHVYADLPVEVGKTYVVSSGCYRTWLLDAEGVGLEHFSFQDFSEGYTVRNDRAVAMRLCFTGGAVSEKDTVTYDEVGEGGTTYESRATASEINFEVSALGLPAGDHILVVKAKADGYNDSEYSNEVVYKAT